MNRYLDRRAGVGLQTGICAPMEGMMAGSMDGRAVTVGTHTYLEPEVPWENIVALYEAVAEYGSYD